MAIVAPASPPDALRASDDETAFVLLRDKVRAMFSYNPTSLAGHAVGAIVVEVVFARVAPAGMLLGWGAAFASLWLLRVALAWRFSRDEPATPDALHARLKVWIAGTLLTAALWGWAAWSFYPFGNALQQITLILVVYTFCVASVPILAPQFALYLGFVGLVYLPAIARVALPGDAQSVQTAVVMFIAMAMTMVLGRDYRAAFEHLSRLQLRTAALLDQLRAEKAASDAARQQAEVANRAKTQFFAAASHDLRQPLHALGLFAEALRQRSREDAVIGLVGSINASVDALDGLFSELLDITRIDTGGVAVNAVDFPIADTFRRLRLHFEPTAVEKGLRLRLRGEHHCVHADPLLVERILRNLLSNAIRYTDEGRVLVSCRRRGERLRLQVWDTGPGVREGEQQKIFEEFYQSPGSAAPRPGQKKGLGLGLAIVRRLAGLMGAPLTLRSVPGRGTVFTLDLPVGRQQPAPGAGVLADAQRALTLEGRLIAVVEDDPGVRDGMEALLTGWGAQVASFDGLEASLQWARGRVDGAVRPHLLIVDYQLDDGRTGVEAINALRAAFGYAIPAIMVTGSTISGADAQAGRDDFQLLIKPVVPGKLRAMIGFKLGMR